MVDKLCENKILYLAGSVGLALTHRRNESGLSEIFIIIFLGVEIIFQICLIKKLNMEVRNFI